MRMIRLLCIVLALTFISDAHAQTSQTRAANESQVNSAIGDNTVGAITPQTMRTVLLNLAASMATLLDINAFTQSPTAPTVSPCSDGTTSVATDAFVQCALAAQSVAISAPQGRLTLQSGQPVQNVDQTDVTTIFYAPYQGNKLPIVGPGGTIASTQFTSSATDQIGLSLALNSSAQPSGHLFDIYAGMSGVLRLCSGPAWSNSGAGSSRGSSAALAMVNGVWVNNLALTCSFSASSFTCPAQQCTWLGTMYADAAGAVSMTIHPAAVAGGSANFIGLCNAYNQVKITAKNQDATSTWNVQVDPPGQLVDAGGPGGGAGNRINFVACTRGQEFTATIRESGAPGSANANALTVGVAMDGATSFSGCAGAGCRLDQIASSSASIGGASQGQFTPYPALGFRIAQAMEESEAAHPFAVFGNDFEMLTVEIEE